MFGIGGFELFLILLFGFLIFGPDRLPGIAKTIGNAIGRFRTAQQNSSKTLQSEVFDKNSDTPFKNPLDAINRIADSVSGAANTEGSAKQSDATIAAETSSGSSAVSSEQTGSDSSSSAESDHVESFAERKARYDRERAERKAAEKKAAEEAAALAENADAVTEVSEKISIDANKEKVTLDLEKEGA